MIKTKAISDPMRILMPFESLEFWLLDIVSNFEFRNFDFGFHYLIKVYPE
jgi:hypothetical protein